MTISSMSFAIVLPAIVYFIMKQFERNPDSESLEAYYGTLTHGLNFNKTAAKFIVPLMLVRRLAFVALIILFQDQ